MRIDQTSFEYSSYESLDVSDSNPPFRAFWIFILILIFISIPLYPMLSLELVIDANQWQKSECTAESWCYEKRCENEKTSLFYQACSWSMGIYLSI